MGGEGRERKGKDGKGRDRKGKDGTGTEKDGKGRERNGKADGWDGLESRMGRRSRW